MDLNSTLRDASFKDDSPVKTVEKIKGILGEYGIKTIEIWNESGVDYCYSLRLNIEGTAFGVNGKGLTREFALASAYGELIERVQLGLFGDSSVQKLGLYADAVSSDAMMSPSELLEQMSDWYEYLSSKAQELDGTLVSGEEILSRFVNGDGKIACMRFFNLMSGKSMYIPRELCGILYGSSGGAAGNSPEEAIVQALSEIVERHFKQRIINECISLPDIPEDVLEKCTVAYGIITALREKGFKVLVKDCSLGTEFPVVCVCYIHKSSGRYHTHFGAYPIFEIALERTLTESFQGRNIESFTSNEDFIYSTKDLGSYRSVYKELKKGAYDKTAEFFVGDCKYPYNASVGFKADSNKELLPLLLKFFEKEGYEVLVYDSSCLGFPTCKVLVPKFSEVILHSVSEKNNSFKNMKSAIKALRNPKSAGFDDYLLLLMHISEMKKLGDLDKRLFNFSTCSNLAMSHNSVMDSYLMASSLGYVYYEMMNPSKALSYVNAMLPLAKKEDADFLLCLKRYLSMTLSGHSDDLTKRLLEFFHSKETVLRLYSFIDSGKNPLSDFVLQCDLESCESCIAKSVCVQRYTSSLISLIHKKTGEMDFEKSKAELSRYCLKN